MERKLEPAGAVFYKEGPEIDGNAIVADIAPVSYNHSQAQYIDAMRRVDLSAITKRSDAEAQLEGVVDDPALIPFFFSMTMRRAKPLKPPVGMT